jgi:hypothetical protein
MNGDSELFLEFSLQSLKEAFACLDLAAGKFPIARIRFADGSLTHQKALL